MPFRVIKLLESYYISAGPPKIRLCIEFSTRIFINRYRILTSTTLNFTLYRSIFIVLHYDAICYFIGRSFRSYQNVLFEVEDAYSQNR